ncbi:MAG: CaiB/BaiF CoA transferase family protein [Thermodesulfobacteriota bacterium]
MARPALDGIRVLDLSRALAGPYCTMMLGDMGADIIKVEMPKVGDEARHYGPPFQEGESSYFLGVNRNKRSITLNLKSQEGKEILRELAKKSDVLVENFRPGTMDDLGLGYQSLRELHPGLVYCAITGFGSVGPDAQRPGYDLIAQGMGGIMSVTGPPEGPPYRVGIAQADIVAGMFAAYGIMVALYHRERTGEGQRLETSLFQGQLAQLTFQAGRYFATGVSPKPQGNQHPLIAPYESFRTKDGHINIAVGNNALWSVFCKVLGMEDYEKDPRFETNPKRVENRPALVQLIEERTSRYTSQELRDILDKAGIPNGPVWKIGEALSAPQTLALGMVQEMDHPKAGRIKVTGVPIHFEVSPGSLRIPPPLLGQHTHEVLKELLGMGDEEIGRLRDRGVI